MGVTPTTSLLIMFSRTEEYHVKRNKPNTEYHITHVFFHMQNLNLQKNNNMKIKRLGKGGRPMLKYLFMYMHENVIETHPFVQLAYVN